MINFVVQQRSPNVIETLVSSKTSSEIKRNLVLLYFIFYFDKPIEIKQLRKDTLENFLLFNFKAIEERSWETQVSKYRKEFSDRGWIKFHNFLPDNNTIRLYQVDLLKIYEEIYFPLYDDLFARSLNTTSIASYVTDYFPENNLNFHFFVLNHVHLIKIMTEIQLISLVLSYVFESKFYLREYSKNNRNLLNNIDSEIQESQLLEKSDRNAIVELLEEEIQNVHILITSAEVTDIFRFHFLLLVAYFDMKDDLVTPIKPKNINKDVRELGLVDQFLCIEVSYFQIISTNTYLENLLLMDVSETTKSFLLDLSEDFEPSDIITAVDRGLFFTINANMFLEMLEAPDLAVFRNKIQRLIKNVFFNYIGDFVTYLGDQTEDERNVMYLLEDIFGHMKELFSTVLKLTELTLTQKDASISGENSALDFSKVLEIFTQSLKSNLKPIIKNYATYEDDFV